MKADEEPGKLYLLPNGLISYCRNTEEDVEYTCTDAFIEKAARYLNRRLLDRVEVVNFGTIIESIISKGELVDDFRNYMKGE